MKLDPSKGVERDVSRTGSLQNHYSEVNPITNHPQLIGVNYWVFSFPLEKDAVTEAAIQDPLEMRGQKPGLLWPNNQTSRNAKYTARQVPKPSHEEASH